MSSFLIRHTRLVMIVRLFAAAFSLAVVNFGFAGVAPLFLNVSTLTNTPQIDARAFVNQGEFFVSSILPYETQNTLVFTNTGLMSGVPGFRLETIDNSGVRRPAQTIYNGQDSFMDAGFSAVGRRFTRSATNLVGSFTLERSQLLLSANDIVNRGHFRADTGGRLMIKGENVDLERSAVGILPLSGIGAFITPTNFFPDVGIIDIYHGMNGATDQNNASTLVLGGLIRIRGPAIGVSVPRHEVTNFIGDPFGFFRSFSLTNAQAFVRTNAVTESNWLVQVVLVQVKDTNIAVDAKFGPSTIPTNMYRTPVVELKVAETNVLDGGNFDSTVYILDRMVSETNFVVLTNLATSITGMPSTYEVTRLTPAEYAGGSGTNALLTANLIANPGYTNAIVTNAYAAYGMVVTNVDFDVPLVAGASLSNAPSRVEISAKNLNLNRTRIRAEGFVSIETENLTGNTNSALDVANLSLNLASAGPAFKLQSLVKPFVQRTAGPVYVWSAAWTNLSGLIKTNTAAPPPPPDPNNPVPPGPVLETNVVEIGFHVMVVDAGAVLTRQPVRIKDFKITNRDVTISDIVRVSDSLLVSATTMTIAQGGELNTESPIHSLTADNFPNLTVFTNRGTVTVPAHLHLGLGAAGPLEQFSNRGRIEGFSHVFQARRFENLGVIEAETGFARVFEGSGTITASSDFMRLEGGAFIAGGAIELHARDLRMRGYTNQTFQPFILDVSNSVADSVEDSVNFVFSEGFHLRRKPALGDLLGTHFATRAPRFLAIDHSWAAEDRGARAEGYENNVALGKLTLDGGLDSLLVFRGTGARNALYVDFLELTNSIGSDFQAGLQIDPSLVIYFADAVVPTNVLAGRTAVELLDGAFADAGAPQGRLRWVRDFAGPLSGVDVRRRDETTVRVNRALVQSETIDTDGDGIPNSVDIFPLDPDGISLQITKPSGPAAQGSSKLPVGFSFLAGPGRTYRIEYTTDLGSGQWQLLTLYTNEGSEPRPALIQQAIGPNEPARFFRVRLEE